MLTRRKAFVAASAESRKCSTANCEALASRRLAGNGFGVRQFCASCAHELHGQLTSAGLKVKIFIEREAA